jgi:hypothetical protein
VIECVSAAGERLSPCFVSSPVSDNVAHGRIQKKFRFEADLILRLGPKCYVKTKLLKEYITIALIPDVNELREFEAFAEKEAVLSMDNHPSHRKDEILSILAKAQMKANSFAAHTTHIFQRLDLSSFENFKDEQQDILPMDSILANVHSLAKIMQKSPPDLSGNKC